MENLDTIVLIEDCHTKGGLIAKILKHNDYKVIWLPTFDMALERLEEMLENPKKFLYIRAIIFDYSLDKEQISIPLLELVVESGFSGPIIANSSDEYFNTLLQQFGCTHVRPGDDKVSAATYTIELLKNNP